MSEWKIQTHNKGAGHLMIMEEDSDGGKFGYLVCELSGHLNGLSYEDNLANAQEIVEAHND